jgi:predicted HD phosphohydrolase
MLMGQIDHARVRIQQLAQLKLDEEPEVPKIPSSDELEAQIKRKEFKVSPELLEKAFTRLVNKVPVKTIGTSRSLYNYNTKRYDTSSPYETETTPSDIFEAIRDVAYADQIKRDLKEYVAKRKEYDAKVKIVNTKAKEVEDYIVLGDVHTALQALKEFESFEV